MARTAQGGAGGRVEGQGEKPSRTESKRRRTDNLTTKSQPSGLRKSTATPSSAQATMSSSRHTPVNSSGQAESKELNTVPAERRVYEQNPRSKSRIGQDHFTTTALPTLHAKRGDNDSLPRRKSSKRKAEDQARERELRAMSSPIAIPKRPPLYAESPLRRDTKKALAGQRKHGDRHASEISLSIPESFSDLGVTSNQGSFKVSALDMLSPRPTVRYSRNPRSTPARSQNVSRNSASQVIAEEDYSSNKRIDTLADSLDATALRELMERDQRRRERKRKTDQARLEQKLKQRAEYEKNQEGQRQDEIQRQEENAIAGLASSSSAAHPAEKGYGRDVSADPFSDDNTIEPELLVPPRLRPGSSIYTRTSQASLSPPTSPTQRTFDRASLSQTSGLPREATSDILDTAELSRSASEHSNVRLGSWTSFFRRGGTRGNRSSVERGRIASGEFSNTSRDSIPRAQPQPPLVGAPRTFRRSGTPQRTQSKFREDLPELPLSPPDSRVQSPEVGTKQLPISAPPGHVDSRADPSGHLATSPSGAIFDQTSEDDQLSQPRIDEPQTPPPIAVLSRSLASVDSEASWLSGKAVKRSSVQRDRPLRQSQSSLQAHLVEMDTGQEEADVADDPYYSRLSPGAPDRRRSSPNSALRKASSTVLNIDPESESEGERRGGMLTETSNERWHSSLGRQPTLIRQAKQARSKEGLLKEYFATDAESGALDDDGSDLDSPDAEDTDLQASSSPIFRAQSVNFGTGHIRHISAGSAKLLDIRRSSMDSKRQSLPRLERSSTPIRNTTAKKEE